jgi:hypothetical protein
MKRDLFKTGRRVVLNSKLRNGLRVKVNGIVVKHFVTKQEAVVKTALKNEIHFSYKNNEVKILGV